MRPLLDIAAGKLVLRNAADTQEGARVCSVGASYVRRGDYYVLPDAVDLRGVVDGIACTPRAAEYIERYNAKRDELLTLQTATDAPVRFPDGLDPYQRVGVRFLTVAERAILNFEPRMGKTATSIRAADEVGAQRVLVVTKLRIVDQWLEEIPRWTALGADASAYTTKSKDVPASRWVVSNYETVWRREDALAQAGFDVIVLDESTKAKNRKTRIANAITRLARDVRYVWLLTGTPIHNWPDELWAQLRVVDPRWFSNNSTSYYKFVARYCELKTTPYGPKVVGANKRTLPELQQRLAMRLLRRERVLLGLPPKSYETVRLDMTKHQERLYRQMEEMSLAVIEGWGGPHVVAAPTALAQLTRLRQMACSPLLLDTGGMNVGGFIGSRPVNTYLVADAKTVFLKEFLDDVGGMQKVLVFTTFAKYAELLAASLSKVSKRTVEYGPALVTGSTPPALAAKEIQRFRNDRDCTVFITTIQSCGEGLTLPEADVVVFTDKMWTPKLNEQAEDRAVGRGKPRSVHVVSLVCKGTVDEYVEQVCQDKDAAASETLAMRRVLELMLEGR